MSSMSREATVWEDFQIRRTQDGICILRYMGRCGSVVIPDRINGEYVTEVGDYALSGLDFVEEVEIGGHVKSLGRHCFYDSRKLRSVILTDHIRDIGDGAFKNCESLEEITLFSYVSRDSCIRAILEECWQEIRVKVVYDKAEAHLVFPEYEIEYFENCSTVPHLFYTEVYGSGKAFRQCLQGTRISYRDYDMLLEKSGRDDRGPVSAGIAMNRLQYPYQLTEERREACRRHLAGHAADAVRWCLEQDKAEDVAMLAAWNIFTDENLQECIGIAEEAGEAGMIAVLLAQSMKSVRPAAGMRRRYEL